MMDKYRRLPGRQALRFRVLKEHAPTADEIKKRPELRHVRSIIDEIDLDSVAFVPEKDGYETESPPGIEPGNST